MKIKRQFLLLIVIVLTASSALAAAPAPALQKSKQDAEAKGYTFLSSHDEIVRLAKQEARVDGIVSLDPETFGPLTKGFKSKYPFLDLKLASNGNRGDQRFLYGYRAARRRRISLISAKIFMGFITRGKRFDILGMAENNVLSIPTKMIDPLSPQGDLSGNDLCSRRFQQMPPRTGQGS
jgi:hypothetical protein